MLLNYIGNLIIITVKESSVQGIWCLNTSSDHITAENKWIRCVTQFHRQWDELGTVRTGMYCSYVYTAIKVQCLHLQWQSCQEISGMTYDSVTGIESNALLSWR